MRVFGFKFPTSMQDDRNLGDIPGFWESFSVDNMLDRIPGRKTSGHSTWAVYGF